MNHIGLFAGIGGFELANQWVWGDDYNPLLFCEIDPFCQKVLKKHWPQVPIHDDIKTLNGEKYAGSVDLVTGGFPCQPYSVAGQRKGSEDDRALWPEMLRVITEARPRWVVAENVAGIRDMDLERVCADLEDRGFRVWPFDIPAYGVDLPTLERHIWIVAEAVSVGRERQRKSAIPEFSGLQAELPGGYTAERERWDLSESKVLAVGERVPDKLAGIAAAGNAIVPQVYAQIAQAIKYIDTQNRRK